MKTEGLRRWLVVAGATLLIVAPSCGDSGDDGDGNNDPEVIFGEGELPSTVPDDFPIPAGATIGSTLVDEINTRTEVTLRMRQEASTVAQFFTVNLVSAGYVLDNSRVEGNRFVIEFRKNAVRGNVDIRPLETGISSAVIELNVA